MKHTVLILFILLAGRVAADQAQEMVAGEPVKMEKSLLGFKFKQLGIYISPASMRPVLYQYPWARPEALQSKYLGLGAWVTGLTGLACLGYPVYKTTAEDEGPNAGLYVGGAVALVSAGLFKLAARACLVRAVELYNSQLKPVPDLKK